MKRILTLLALISVPLVVNAQWKFTRSNTYPVILYSHDTTIFTYDKAGRVWALCPHSDVRYYADTGIRPGQADKIVKGFASIGSTLFSVGASLYASTDNGRHWAQTAETFPYPVSGIIAIDSQLIFNWNYAIQRSTDLGKTWTQVSGLSPAAFAFSNGVLYAASATQFFRSTDTGNTWVKTADQGAAQMVALGPDIFAGRAYSRDSGNTWVLSDSVYPNSVATDGQNVFAAGNNRYVWATSDRGRTWLIVDPEGLPGYFNATAICVFDSFLYVGGYDPVTHDGSGLYYRPISEILPKNAVSNPHTMPAADRLDVYPNPFGTSCTVAFTLDAPSDVRVSLYDAAGREVRTAFAGSLPRGLNTLPIEAGTLPDGIYWCRLAANGAERIAKLSLMRR